MVFVRPESLDEPRTSYALIRCIQDGHKNKDGTIDREDWDGIMEFAAPYMNDHGMLAIPVSGQGERLYSEILWKINEDTPETPSPLVVGD